jgi:hypothetical protein
MAATIGGEEAAPPTGGGQSETKTVNIIPNYGVLFRQFECSFRTTAKSLIRELPGETHADFHTVLHGITMCLLSAGSAEELERLRETLSSLSELSCAALSEKREGAGGDEND